VRRAAALKTLYIQRNVRDHLAGEGEDSWHRIGAFEMRWFKRFANGRCGA